MRLLRIQRPCTPEPHSRRENAMRSSGAVRPHPPENDRAKHMPAPNYMKDAFKSGQNFFPCFAMVVPIEDMTAELGHTRAHAPQPIQ